MDPSTSTVSPGTTDPVLNNMQAQINALGSSLAGIQTLLQQFVKKGPGGLPAVDRFEEEEGAIETELNQLTPRPTRFRINTPDRRNLEQEQAEGDFRGAVGRETSSQASVERARAADPDDENFQVLPPRMGNLTVNFSPMPSPLEFRQWR